MATRNLSAKNKIFIAVAVWAASIGAMFGYFFGLLDFSNQGALRILSQQNKELQNLKTEKESYELASADLQAVKAKAYQPEDFFGRDVTFVKEIITLEQLAQKLGLDLALSGVSGTVGRAPSAKTATPLAAVPFSITLKGSFGQVVNYIDAMENLSFITTSNTLNVTGQSNGSVIATMNANFYLRKQ